MPVLIVWEDLGTDLLRQIPRCLHQIFIGNNPVHQGELKRPTGIHLVAGEQHFHGMLTRHVSAQRHHRCRTEQSDVDPRCAELRALSGHGKITACNQLATGGTGDRMHLCDDRLGAMDDGLHQGCALFEQGGEVGTAAIVIAAPRRHFLQIVSGTECRTVGGK